MPTEFNYFYKRAANRKGGDEELQTLIEQNLSSETDLSKLSSDQILSAMTKQIFRAGFVWKVVEQKWLDFEEVFNDFDVQMCSELDEGDLLDLKLEKRIIRNFPKIKTVQENAEFILSVEEKEKVSFGEFLDQWPSTDLIGLWDFLKKGGARLGGMTGQYFLRFIGKDSFILSKDVVAALIESGVVQSNPTSQKALKVVQEHFNIWHHDSKKTFNELSRILAFSIDSEDTKGH